MQKHKALITATAIYIVIGIATFGNAAVYFERRGDKEVRACLEQRQQQRDAPYICSWKESSGVAAGMSFLVWPFYWSYRIAQ